MTKTNKVIHLGQVRDLRAEWDKVKEAINAGSISGFSLTVRDGNGREMIYAGGVFKTDPDEALAAMLKMSAVRTLAEDDPPRIQANSM